MVEEADTYVSKCTAAENERREKEGNESARVRPL